MDNNYNDPFYGNNENQSQNNSQGYNGGQDYNGGYNNPPSGNGGYNHGSSNITPYSGQNSVFMKRVLPIFLAVLLLTVGFILGFFIKDVTLSEEERLAKWVWETIDKNYLFDLTDAEREYIMSNMGKGAIYSIDQFSDFYTPSEISELNANFSGEYVGVGFSYGQAEDENGKFIYVSQVFGSYGDPSSEDFIKTPAEGNLKKYDRFVSLTYYTNSSGQYVSKGTSGAVPKPIYFEKIVTYPNGKSKTEYSSISEVYYAFENIPIDITFEVVVNREGRNTDAIELTKQVYNPAFVKYESVNDKTAHITLMSFMGNAEKEIAAAMERFSNEGKENLILDLRDNGGGAINILNGIASYFITDAKKSNRLVVGYMERKNGKRETMYTTAGNKYNSSIKKTVILFNESTASASEALIGAMLHYNSEIQTIGTNSYGKGIRQAPYEMLGYCIYITDARMLWPDGTTCIHGVKITPKVEVSDAYYISGNDNQLEAAKAYTNG